VRFIAGSLAVWPCNGSIGIGSIGIGSIGISTANARVDVQQFEQLRNDARTPSAPRIVNEPENIGVPGQALDAHALCLQMYKDRKLGPDGAARDGQQQLPPSSLGGPTEFQTYVEWAVGRELPLFGHNSFTTAPSTFAPIDQVGGSDPKGQMQSPLYSLIQRRSDS
jgi:hypothetical protein